MKYSYLEDVLFLKIKCFSPSTISSFRKRPNGAADEPPGRRLAERSGARQAGWTARSAG